MRTTIALLTMFVGSAASAQTTATLCQADEVPVAKSTIDLRLVGCGAGFHDNLLWHLDRADAIDGVLNGTVTRTLTGKGAVLYMCDTGVLHDHDELMRADGSVVIASIYPGGAPKACPNAAIEPSYDTTSDPSLFINTHGTATASVAVGRNTGVAPDAKIISVYMTNVGTNIDLWLKGFDQIIQNAWNPATPQFRTAIINMSLWPNYASKKDSRYPRFEEKMREMINGVAADGSPDASGKRFLFVSVAGNSGVPDANQCDPDGNTDAFPSVLGSSIDGFIAVGGIDETNHLWAGSCKGAALDILAPAANMFVASISGHDHYRSGHEAAGSVGNSGTSYSAPYVSGLAALLLERNPEYTPQQLEAIIKASASHTANADETAGGGMVAIFDFISGLPRQRILRH